MRYYPVALDTKNKNALIIGGGKAAYQKLISLMKSDYTIHMISKDFIPQIQELYGKNFAESNHTALPRTTPFQENAPFLEKAFLGRRESSAFTMEELSLQSPLQDDLLESVDFLVIATDDQILNEELTYKATRAGIPHLRCDKKEEGNCIFQSIIQRGDLSIAIGTQGKSPLFSALLKEELEAFWEQDLEERISLLEKLRSLLIMKKQRGISIKEGLSPWMKADLQILRQHIQQMEENDEV